MNIHLPWFFNSDFNREKLIFLKDFKFVENFAIYDGLNVKTISFPEVIFRLHELVINSLDDLFIDFFDKNFDSFINLKFLYIEGSYGIHKIQNLFTEDRLLCSSNTLLYLQTTVSVYKNQVGNEILDKIKSFPGINIDYLNI